MTAAVITILVTAGIIAAAVSHRRIGKRVRSFLQGREPLSEGEFARLFSSPLEGDVGVSIRELLKPWISVDVTLLRPDDEFCKQLLLDARDGLDPEEFLRSVEDRWAVGVARTEAERILTIRQLAAAVAKRLRATQPDRLFDTDAQTRPAAARPALNGRR